jgi:CubicO group peptidase (beta-lactamase class C family)
MIRIADLALLPGLRGLVLGAFLGVMTAPALADDAASLTVKLLPAPVAPVPPLLGRQQVDAAIGQLDAVVEATMAKTGVPGVAVVVVYRNEILYAKGFGLREVGRPEPVDTDTVFLLASVSKPITSTILAGLVGDELFDWDDPVRDHDPSFALSDPYVTEQATFADLLSHRSGLNTGAGDLLEDLGFDRETILSRLDQQPLNPFRSSYHYSNLGYTAGAIAAAKAADEPFEDLAERILFGPLGMSRSSFRHADYLGHANRARIHVRVGDPAERRWEARHDRMPDAEAPAGGASGSITDLAQFLRLQLGEGIFEGEPIVAADALATTHLPHIANRLPAEPTERAGFYGLGWNVGYDDLGRVTLGHSGAFALGTSTAILMLPGEGLGIAAITNGEPIGVPEAIGSTFMDIAQNGHQTVDWLSFIGGFFADALAAEQGGSDYAQPPVGAAPPGPLETYVGTYENSYYGPLVVEAAGDALSMLLGPAGAPTRFPLSAYDGDTFTFQPIGENAVPLSAARFQTRDDGSATGVTLEFYDRTGLGTFTRN